MKGNVIMRVISGKYKGKTILGFDIEGTRPTQDRVKESLFGIIQNDIIDATCLDLFAGSGNLGIEALSNGASMCYFVDNNSKCIEIIKKNLNNIENSNVINLDYMKALDYFKNNNIAFDIVFLDPPYNLNCIDNIIDKILEYNLINNEGLIICEYEFNNFKEKYNSLELIKDKKYGYKNIKIYKKN